MSIKAISHCRAVVVFAGLLWAATTVCPGPGQTQPSTKSNAAAPRLTQAQLADLEKQMYDLVNRARQDPAYSAETHGQAQPLRWNEKLAAVARAHSHNMVEQNFFSHTDPDGTTFGARITAAGIRWRSVAENIANYGTVTSAEASFMSEPPFQSNHRGNILSVTATDVGIGIAQGPTGSLYITQDFVATPLGHSRGSSSP